MHTGSKAILVLTLFQEIFSLVSCQDDFSYGIIEQRRKGDIGLDYTFPYHSDYDVTDDPEEKKSVGKSVKNPVRGEKEKLLRICPHYKNGEYMDLDKMADEWQIVYYDLSEEIMCFKLNIRKTTEKERKELFQRYGHFGQTVDWRKCLLELRGSASENLGRKHFLMGDNSTKGVFENVIITEWDKKNNRESSGTSSSKHSTTFFRIFDEPDQWRVVGDLLLMRACRDGRLVVFARLPRPHARSHLHHALTVYGEEDMLGKMVCDILKL